jgi:hypothetical protein
VSNMYRLKRPNLSETLEVQVTDLIIDKLPYMDLCPKCDYQLDPSLYISNAEWIDFSHAIIDYIKSYIIMSMEANRP